VSPEPTVARASPPPPEVALLVGLEVAGPEEPVPPEVAAELVTLPPLVASPVETAEVLASPDPPVVPVVPLSALLSSPSRKMTAN
jgi:hypothetical protein